MGGFIVSVDSAAGRISNGVIECEYKSAGDRQHNEIMLNIEGKYEAAHIFGDFIAREYAFSCHWKGRELRVAHHKGTWFLAKFDGEVLKDQLEITDAPDVSDCSSPLLKALADEIVFANAKWTDSPNDIGCRARMGIALSKLVGVWVYPLENMERIEVHQPGRNAFLDGKGEFSFSS